jgi:DNA invertase Pin-like site-specific DNA recombinase
MDDIVYLRVSKKDEKEQDIETQKIAIMERFKLSDPVILQERGTAFDLSKIKNRLEFIKLLNYCFDADKTTIKDLFLQNHTVKKNINIYIWDYNRIMRNIEFNLFFSLLCIFYEVTLNSYRDNNRIKVDKTDADSRMISILFDLLASKRAEDYSSDISKNTKKSFKKRLNSSYSIKDKKKVGRHFKNRDGDIVNLSPKKEDLMVEKAISLITMYEKNTMKNYYPKLIKELDEEFGILLSVAYISSLKKKVTQCQA